MTFTRRTLTNGNRKGQGIICETHFQSVDLLVAQGCCAEVLRRAQRRRRNCPPRLFRHLHAVLVAIAEECGGGHAAIFKFCCWQQRKTSQCWSSVVIEKTGGILQDSLRSTVHARRQCVASQVGPPMVANSVTGGL
jgi:hypothetical protein